MNYQKSAPVMPSGRYVGKRVDTLPASYLRWVIMHDFPKDIVEAAKRKLADSHYSNEYITISRHAIDMYSKRFLMRWLKFGFDINYGYPHDTAATPPVVNVYPQEMEVGLASHIAAEAQMAWNEGLDISKKRHIDDGIIKLSDEIQWVFAVSPHYPDYRELITVMVRDDKSKHQKKGLDKSK